MPTAFQWKSTTWNLNEVHPKFNILTMIPFLGFKNASYLAKGFAYILKMEI